MLLVEIGLFHWVRRKGFQKPTRERVRFSGKIYWSNNKGLLPASWCLTHDQMAQLHLAAGKSNLWGCKPTLAPTKLRMTRAQSTELLCLISPPEHGPWRLCWHRNQCYTWAHSGACTWAWVPVRPSGLLCRDNAGTNEWTPATHTGLLKLWIYYLRFGREQAFFQTNLSLS